VHSPVTENVVQDSLLRWIVLLPLLGAAINGLLNRRLPRPAVGAIACGAVGLSFVLSVVAFLRLVSMPADARLLTDIVAPWLGYGPLSSSPAWAC
jgi:NADH-quinone oxidoreductase subunit L